MKKKRELTKKEQEANLRFIVRGPIYLKKNKKLINHRATKENMVLMLTSLWSSLEKVRVFRKERAVKANMQREVRKYKNIPAYGKFNKYSRKVLTGMYGNALSLARAEGLV